jgi:hypothetical protein
VEVACVGEVPEEQTVFIIRAEVNSVYVLIKNIAKMIVIEVISVTFK